jgi:hypothetical protein
MPVPGIRTNEAKLSGQTGGWIKLLAGYYTVFLHAE